MRKNGFHIAWCILGSHDRVVNWHFNFGTYADLGREETVKRVIDHAFGGVLDRYNPVVCRLRLDFPEHIVYRGQGAGIGKVPELLDGSCLGVRPFWAKICHSKRHFEVQTRGDDLAKERRNVFVRERSGIFIHQPGQYLGFSLGSIKHSRRITCGALLYLSNLQRTLRSIV